MTDADHSVPTIVPVAPVTLVPPESIFSGVDASAVERAAVALATLRGETEATDDDRHHARVVIASLGTAPAVAYMVDGNVEQGLFFDRAAAETMAFANCGTVRPLAFAAAPGSRSPGTAPGVAENVAFLFGLAELLRMSGQLDNPAELERIARRLAASHASHRPPTPAVSCRHCNDTGMASPTTWCICVFGKPQRDALPGAALLCTDPSPLADTERLAREIFAAHREQYVGTSIWPMHTWDEVEQSTRDHWTAIARRLTGGQADAGALTAGERAVIEILLVLAYKAWCLADNGEDNGKTITVDRADYELLSAELDKLDELPDDQPGYVMGESAKARWALRRVLGEQTGERT